MPPRTALHHHQYTNPPAAHHSALNHWHLRHGAQRRASHQVFENVRVRISKKKRRRTPGPTNQTNFELCVHNRCRTLRLPQKHQRRTKIVHNSVCERNSKCKVLENCKNAARMQLHVSSVFIRPHTHTHIHTYTPTYKYKYTFECVLLRLCNPQNANHTTFRAPFGIHRL